MDYSLRNLISSIENLDHSDPRFPQIVRKIRRTKKEQSDEWKVRLLSRLREQLTKEEGEDLSVVRTMDPAMVTVLEKEIGDFSNFYAMSEYPPLFNLEERVYPVVAPEESLLMESSYKMAVWVSETYNSKSAEALTCELQCDICPAVKRLNCYFQNVTAISSDSEE